MSDSPLLSKDLHDKWKAQYRTPENFRFYDIAYATIQEYFGAITGPVMDAGCGTGEKTIRLGAMGYRAVGVDYAPVALAEARANVASQRQSQNVEFVRSDLTQLPFPDNSFEGIVIWGVLMHVPDLPAAVAELCRVLKPGGKIVVYDAHAASLDVQLLKLAKRLTGRGTNTRTALGIENWVGSKETPVMLRWVHYSALKGLFDQNGVSFESRRAGRFTELFVYLPSALRRLVHAWNALYFRSIRWASPAYGVMAFARKRAALPLHDSPSRS